MATFNFVVRCIALCRLLNPFRIEEARCEAAGIISEVRMHNLRDGSLRRSQCGSFCPNAPIKSRT